jgi:flagellar protein FlaG
MSIEIQLNKTTSMDNQLQNEPGLSKVNVEKEVAKPAQEVSKAEAPKKAEDEVKVTEISREKVADAVSKLQDYADQYKRELRFSIDEESGKTVVRLLDSEDKVLRQIPSEDVLSLAKSLQEGAGGLFEDQV